MVQLIDDFATEKQEFYLGDATSATLRFTDNFGHVRDVVLDNTFFEMDASDAKAYLDDAIFKTHCTYDSSAFDAVKHLDYESTSYSLNSGSAMKRADGKPAY